MSDLLERVERSIRTRALLKRGQAVLVSVSGGLDSMVLLHLLHELASRHRWRLTVAHLNHRLRGRSSEADERLVVRTARRLQLPVVTERADIKGLARCRKVSIEMAARSARHDFLARSARRLKIHSVALAHHADDQLELFFLRLFRGSGGEGLAGMKWRSSSPSDPRLQLIRPLLDQSKAELRSWAGAHQVPFREDASNARIDIQRNRVRHELLPWLRTTYQPALDRTVLRLMDIAGAEAEFVTRTAAEWLGSREHEPFSALPVAVQRRCLQLQLLRQNIPADYDLVERLRLAPGVRITMSPGLAVARDAGGSLRLYPLRASMRSSSAVGTGSDSDGLKVDLQTNDRCGSILFGGVRFDWRITLRRGALPARFRPGQELFDADKIGSAVLLRHWQPGDRFQPSGMQTAVKLQDLFTNRKIPRAQRHELVVATTAGGEVFWVEKLRVSERFKLSGATIRRLQWRWNRL